LANLGQRLNQKLKKNNVIPKSKTVKWNSLSFIARVKTKQNVGEEKYSIYKHTQYCWMVVHVIHPIIPGPSCSKAE